MSRRNVVELLLGRKLEGNDQDLVFNLLAELDNLVEFKDQWLVLGLIKRLLDRLLDEQAVALEFANWRFARVVCRGEVSRDYIDIYSGESITLSSSSAVKSLLVIDLVRLRDD